MAEHNLFLGGQRTPRGGFYEMLPSSDALPNQPMTPATHKEAAQFALTRHLSWKDNECFSTGASTQSKALCSYLERNTIAVGDVLNLVIMSKHTSLLKVWWKINAALTGFTFDLQIRGNAQSLGGTVAAPVVKVLAADVDGSVVPTDAELCNFPSGVIGIAPNQQGDPLAEGIYFDQNDMLQMVIKTLPPEGIACSEIMISPVIETYCEGSY